jgi:hypothetical protein
MTRPGRGRADGRVRTATVLVILAATAVLACGEEEAGSDSVDLPPMDVPAPGVSPRSPGRGFDTVFVYFTTPDETRAPAPRPLPDTADAVRAAFDALLRGPAPGERAAGLQSWFSAETAGMVRSVSISDGFAVVDFQDLRPVIPNAVSSAGALMLLGELTATAFQFPGVRRVEFRIEGDCEALMAWLQMGCHPIRRDGWDPPVAFREAVPASVDRR